MSNQGSDHHYNKIEQAIAFLEANFQDQPSLEVIAASVGLSKYHFQRLFKSFAGITPTQFLHYLTVEYAKSRLIEAESVLDSALDSGLSGGGRLHDMFVNIEGMTPGEYKAFGEGVHVYYGVHSTPFGEAFLATTKRGICSLMFLKKAGEAGRWLQEAKTEWPKAHFQEKPSVTLKVMDSIFNRKSKKEKLSLLVKGTNFQVKVWKALLSVPEGCLLSYETIATHIKKTTATRAVASAIAKNPVAYLIPCHRVISKTGAIHRYRWGHRRKKIMIGYEAAHTEKS